MTAGMIDEEGPVDATALVRKSAQNAEVAVSEASRKIRVLFVCTGNICRSPTAEGVFRHLVRLEGLSETIEADSAGTHGSHVGEPPDERARAEAADRGYDLSGIVARRIDADDFHRFDLILAMDRGHHSRLSRLAPDGARGRLRLFMEFAAGEASEDVPDPYYGSQIGFTRVLDMIEAGAEGLLAAIRDGRL
jgi:protein-tyrosine phosphatase